VTFEHPITWPFTLPYFAVVTLRTAFIPIKYFVETFSVARYHLTSYKGPHVILSTGISNRGGNDKACLNYVKV